MTAKSPRTAKLRPQESRVYKIIYSYVDEKSDALVKSLKIMVGAKGFEPSTSWSRTRRASQAALRPDGGDLATRVVQDRVEENADDCSFDVGVCELLDGPRNATERW